ncbi:hypothetical protein V8C40DRAFT_108690 [Trichoderma camerunense]
MEFTPTAEETDAFQILQQQLTTGMTLYHHNPDRPTFFKLDASGRGMGLFVFHVEDDTWNAPNVLQSKIQPVMFLSRLLSKPGARYKPTELEVACLVWSCHKLRTSKGITE